MMQFHSGDYIRFYGTVDLKKWRLSDWAWSKYMSSEKQITLKWLRAGVPGTLSVRRTWCVGPGLKMERRWEKGCGQFGRAQRDPWLTTSSKTGTSVLPLTAGNWIRLRTGTPLKRTLSSGWDHSWNSWFRPVGLWPSYTVWGFWPAQLWGNNWCCSNPLGVR